MAVIAIVVAVPLTLLIRDDDSGGSGAGGDASPPVATQAVPEPDQKNVNRKLGVALRVPPGWRKRGRGDVLTLRSRDRRAAVVISAPAAVEYADQIYGQAIESIRDQYRKVKVRQRLRGQRLGGRRAKTAALVARRPDNGGEMRILVSVAKGRKQAYLVEVFASAPNPGPALLEAQALLNGLELRG